DRNEKNPTCAIYIEDQNPPPVDDIESQHPLDDFFPRTLWAYFKTLSVWRGLYSLEHVLVLSRNAEVAPIVELLFVVNTRQQRLQHGSGKQQWQAKDTTEENRVVDKQPRPGA